MKGRIADNQLKLLIVCQLVQAITVPVTDFIGPAVCRQAELRRCQALLTVIYQAQFKLRLLLQQGNCQKSIATAQIQRLVDLRH